MRKTGIDIIGDAVWGTHFCQFYKTKRDLIDILVPYFKAGLENNEFCMWVTSKPLTEKDAAKTLSKVLPDFDSYLKKGQIEIIPHDRWYLRNGVFNSKKVLRGWLKKLDKALSKGYDGLRLTGNTFWLGKKDWRNFTDYEKEVDSVIGKYKIIALCTYSLDKCKASEVIDVVQNHQFALIKREDRWEIVENSERKRAEDEINRFASFPQLNPNPVLEVNSSGIIVFSNAATVQTLRKLDLWDADVFLPDDITDILNALEQEKEVQFYREVKIKDRIFGEVLYLTPQFDSIRIYANDISERKAYQEDMQNALLESRRRSGEIAALLEGSRAVLKYHDFESAARSIFDSCKQMIGATSGYIALLSEDGSENEVLFLDSGGLPCSVDPGLPMPIRGLRGEAYNNVKTVYDNDFHQSEWMKFMPDGHARLENVLFAPMIVEGKAVGLLGIANKPGGFTENDARMASAFAELAAIALTQKRAEEALRHSEEYFRLVTENASDVITILKADGTIKYESLSVEHLLGYEPQELVGTSAFDLIHPDDLSDVTNIFSHGVKNPGIVLSAQLRCKHKDGSWRFLDVIGKNLLDNPAISGIVINSRDITERKQAEEALIESREDLDRAQVVGNIGSWRLDVQRNILTWSDENHSIFGLPKGTPMTYETFLSIVHPDDREYVDTKWKAGLAGEDYDIEHRIIVDGKIKWVREKAYLEFDKNDALLGGFGITQDITERKQMEAELRRSRDELEIRVQKRTAELTKTVDALQNQIEDRIRAQEAVKAERQRLYSVLEKLPAYVCLLTHDYTFAYVNQEFKRLFGDPGDRQCYEYLFNCQEPCEGCQTYRIFTDHKDEQEWEWVGPNGNTFAIFDHAFSDIDGTPLILEMGLDITERKKAVDHLSVTGKLLEFFVTKNGRKEYLDSAVDLLHKWTDCNCIGIRVLDKLGNIPYESYRGFSSEFWEAENWISVKNDQCACSRVVLQKPDTQDMSMMTPNGSFYCNDTETFAGLLVEKELPRYRGLCIRTGYKSIAIIPIRYKDAVIGALHIADKRDGMVPTEKIEFIESLTPLIGEAIFRFSAEEALEASEERYRMLVDTMNEGLGIDDENGLLVYANDRLCEMLGYSRDKIIGRPVLSFFGKKNQNILREQTEKRKSGESEPYRIEWIKKDGQKIITLVSPRPIFDENGHYRGSFAVITDITEKLRLESIAEALNTMDNIGFIFSGVRHEIGNPVNSIKIALSVLKQNIDLFSKDTVKEYADRMLSEISRMEYLLKAMKNFNMFETVKPIDMDMADFIKKFLSIVVDDFEKKGIKIETPIVEPVWVYADPRALHQILLNIMTNAADALEKREDPRIEISIFKMADMVNIRIEDNGIGLSEEQQKDLFKPFYTTKSRGTGLGLVITKKMMTKMKGFIEVVSEKDKGTIVDLYIPEGISEEE
jgi:PAS domain S-box-containing protein